MDVGVYPYSHGDPLLIDKIVNEFLSQGKFDKLRKECMSDADTKPAYQNLQQRVENTVTQFLKKQVWRPDLNKNQLRDSLRKHILESKFFDAGINRIVDQVVNPNVLATVFLPEVEEVVYNYLSIPRPFDKNQRRDEKVRPSGREYENKALEDSQRCEKYGRERLDCGEAHKRENHMADEDCKGKELFEKKLTRDIEEPVKTEPADEERKAEDKIKLEPEDEALQQQAPEEKTEMLSDESQESLNRMAAEGLHINEPEAPPLPDSDDSVPLEINEKSMSESRDSEDSIMNQMSPISQGRLTPELEEELPEAKPEEPKPEAKEEEEKKPLTFIGRIPKIKREDSDSSKSSKTKEDTPRKEKLDVKNIYSSDESDSSKSYGKSDSDDKRRKGERSGKEERKREDPEKKQKEKKRESSKERKSSKDRHKDHKRERSRERHKKSSSSSSSSQRERSSSHHKSSHRHKDSKSRRKEEEEKKKSKSTDDHGKERNKKEDRRSTDRDSNERERGRSTGGRGEGEGKKREKEQQKTEEVRGGERNQAEEGEAEKEGGTASEPEERARGEAGPVESEGTGADPRVDGDGCVLDFGELFQAGALSKLEFPKLTDDFYVKFNSTGFRYFEEWEKAKLDCEEEFKEFVDEAENNLSLLSDEETDFELESRFEEENEKTKKNLLKGLGNFRRSLMFDPRTSEFYKWTNTKFYLKFRKKGEKRGGSGEKGESDESIKENIDRGEKRRALHLKLINRYRRKALRMGKTRRRQRKPDSGGIKEKNENGRASEYFGGVEGTGPFLASRGMNLPERSGLVAAEDSTVPNGVNSLSDLYGGEGGVTLPESPEENEEWSRKQPTAEVGTPRGGKLSQSLPLHLPPSPDSDDVGGGIDGRNVAVSRKRGNKDSGEGGLPKKQTKRNCSQKYDSQDLYKPRPILNGSRTRGRERGVERDLVGSGEAPGRYR